MSVYMHKYLSFCRLVPNIQRINDKYNIYVYIHTYSKTPARSLSHRSLSHRSLSLFLSFSSLFP